MDCKCLHIGKPFIEKKDNRSYLKAEITIGDNKKVLSYGVDSKYEKYLVTERSDCFVTALLYFAMIKNYDIEWEVPCSKQLIYQLTTYFLPVYEKEFLWVNKINITGPVTDEMIKSVGGVATGLSNGVDSTYTVKKYMEMEYPYKLTALLFTDWFITDNSEEYQKDFIHKNLSILPKCSEELGLDFIYVEFHPDVNFSVGHIKDKKRGMIQDSGLFTLKYCSLAMALKKMINVYYFSSGYSPSDFTFNKDDMSFHDIFTLPLITTDDLKFYSTGMEVNRLEKVRYIADWEYAQKHLQVCAWDNGNNCGRCSKCLRTMSELDAIGKLDDFSLRFPVEDWRKNYVKRMGKVLMENNRGHIFEIDVIKEMKKKGKKIPYMSKILANFYLLVEFFRKKLRRNIIARKIYRKYGLDKILYGRSTLNYSRSVDREILSDNNE